MSEEQANNGGICFSLSLGRMFPPSKKFKDIYSVELTPEWYNLRPTLSKKEINCTCDILSPLLSSKDVDTYNTIDWKILHKCLSGSKETCPKKIYHIQTAVIATTMSRRDALIINTIIDF